MKEEFIAPEMFWELYAKMLNEKGTSEAYKNDSAWTEIIIPKVTEMIHSEMELKTQNEYFRIDVTGYTTKWEEEKEIAKQREKEEGGKMPPLHNWKLRIAYEHENSDDWSDELCKLCHITADLKVISSYCHFSRDNIEKTLQYYICKLKKEGTLRQEGGKWLFVFGPRKNNGDSIKTYSGDSFKAFTLDDRLNVIPLKEIKMSFCTG